MLSAYEAFLQSAKSKNEFYDRADVIETLSAIEEIVKESAAAGLDRVLGHARLCPLITRYSFSERQLIINLLRELGYVAHVLGGDEPTFFSLSWDAETPTADDKD